MSSQPRYLGLALLVAAVAALIRLVPLAFVAGTDRIMDVNTDSEGYVELAQALRHGCGFTRFVNGKCGPLPRFAQVTEAERSVEANLFPDIVRTPGYPFFLSLMPNLSTALVVQALLSGLMVFAVSAFVSTRWGPGAALISSALAAFDVPGIVYSDEIMTETLFTVLFVLGTLSALCAVSRTCSIARRVALVALSSMLFGGAAIVRPVGEFALAAPALIPLAFAGVSWAKRIGFVALLILVPALVIGGWSLRNYRVTGVAYFSPIGGVNLYYYRALPTLSYAMHSKSQIELPRPVNLSSESLKIIAHHPVAFARLTAWSFLYLCFAPDRAPLEHLLGTSRLFPIQPNGSVRALAALYALPTSPRATLYSVYQKEFDSSPTVVALTALQLLMIVVLWIGVAAELRVSTPRSDKEWCILFCLATPLILMLLASGTDSLDRHRIAALPLLAIVSGIGWVDAVVRVQQRRGSKRDRSDYPDPILKGA